MTYSKNFNYVTFFNNNSTFMKVGFIFCPSSNKEFVVSMYSSNYSLYIYDTGKVAIIK